MRKTKTTLVVIALLVAIMTGAAGAYTGSMSSLQGEMQGTGFWASEGTTLSWAVTWDASNNWWHYSYNLVVPRAAISHMIVEASNNFTTDDLLNAVGPFTKPVDVDTYTTANGNPFIPSSLYGIKFNDTVGTNVTVSFDSYRMPVWGDFYAKCGNVGGTQNTIWNSGFTAADPIAAATNGAYMGHLLVPDTVTPEPASLVALGLGLSGFLAVRRKRS